MITIEHDGHGWNFYKIAVLSCAWAKKSSSEGLWGRAVVCAQAAHATPDPQKRALLIYFGEFWLELSRQDTSQISEATATDLAVMERLEAKILGLTLTSH
jgi:hypothetical protein